MGWKAVPWKQRLEYINSIRKIIKSPILHPERCFIDTLSLSFYTDAELLKLVGDGVPDAPQWFLKHQSEIMVLRGSLNNIYYCNSVAVLHLTDETVNNYLRFFYFFAENAHVFEMQVRRSSVGYTGKVWLFQKDGFFEVDINLNTRGSVTELEKTVMESTPALQELTPETLGF